MDEVYRTYGYTKLFYRPIEIALRWCGMMKFEAQVLKKAEASFPLERTLASWPCLLEKIDLLNDAIRNQELVYGCLGVTVSLNDPVERSLMTIRHTDLKRWFIKYHPAERPNFIFDEFEKQYLSRHTIEVHRALLVELDICKAERERTRGHLQDVTEERDLLKRENAQLIAQLRSANKPNERAERSYLLLIGALITLLLGKTPSGKPYSSFASQASIISVLTARNRGKPGFNKRSLEEKFAAAKRLNENAD
ncbi:hypothetical protein [Pseudomonas lini]